LSNKEEKPKYGSASIPMGILEEIDYLIEKLRYWPSRGSFIREACLEKIRRERERLREIERRRSTSSPGD